MKKDEYLAEVTAGIKNKQVKQEICAELGEHIDELADFYLDRGYSDTEAEEKAVSDMGDGEKVGYDMSKLHKTGFFGEGLKVLILLFNLYITIFLAWKPVSEFCLINLICEALVIFATYAVVRAKAKRYNLFGILGIIAIYTLYFGLKSLYYPSAVSTYLLYFFKGRTDAFAILPYVSNINFSTHVLLVSAAFYAIMLIPIIVSAVLIYLIGKSNGKVKTRSVLKGLSVIMYSFACTVLIILALTAVETGKYSYQRYNTILHDIAIAQSDNPCDVAALKQREDEAEAFSTDIVCGHTIEKISSANTFNLEVQNWSDSYERYAPNDVSPNFKFRQRIGLRTTEIDKDVSYDVIVDEIEIVPTNRYMYLKPFDYVLPSGVEEEYWLRTNEEHVIVYSLDNARIPHSMLEITIHNREMNQNADGIKATESD